MPGVVPRVFGLTKIFCPFDLLQIKCAACKLSSVDFPPSEIGIMWSILTDMGSGYFNDLSRGSPHNAHIVAVFLRMVLLCANIPLSGPS